MKKYLLPYFIVCAFLLGCAAPKEIRLPGPQEYAAPETLTPPQTRRTYYIIIGTGGITGVYYPTGGAICRILNKKRKVSKIRCTAESTGGSVYNINAVMAGDLDFGMAQSDRQYQAWNGFAEWRRKGPQDDLRAVFSVHAESVTLVAAVDSGIKTIQDLRGKRVNIGNPGSGQRQNSIDALENAGINYKRDLKAKGVRAAEAPGLLQKGRIDAFFYTVGHPSGAIKWATSGKRKVRFVPITGVDGLIERYPYYAKALIPVKFYPGVANRRNVKTFGVKATLVTYKKMPNYIVYSFAKEVFENFDAFKRLHPAYSLLTKKDMLEALSAPIHPGAATYYRDVGLIGSSQRQTGQRPEPGKQQLAYIPEDHIARRIHLRSQPKKLSIDDIKSMLSKYNFYDKDFNPEGSFANYFEDNRDGTVTDRLTGLMWLLEAPMMELEPSTIWHPEEFLEILNKKRFAGYSDWRLPTIEELASLMCSRKENGLHLAPAFSLKQSRFYYSGDTRNARSYWIADLGLGVLTTKSGIYMRQQRLLVPVKPVRSLE
jgi:TRAP transporter TAXI family solute receptor